MTRLAEKFHDLKVAQAKGFIPYITAGDPSLEHTRHILAGLMRAGADVIEIGVPFSDPLADGLVIQRASQRALAAGANLAGILEMIGEIRRTELGGTPRPAGAPSVGSAGTIPLVLFSYLNPIWQMGVENFARRAKDKGVDGVLITDLTAEEALPIKEIFDAQDLDLIFLIAPTSTDERVQRICSLARGFIYAVSRTGTTGARASLSQDLEELTSRIRRHSDLPIAVGFGISSCDQVEQVWQVADAAVVGSAIVRCIETETEKHAGTSTPPPVWAAAVEDFVRAMIPARPA